jgi:hypothetical protein
MFWKLYSGLLAAMFLVGVAVEIIRFGGVLRLLDVAGWIVQVVSITGLFGFVWRQQILSRPFWQIFVPVSLAWMVLYRLVLYNPRIFFGSIATQKPELILGGIFFVPLYVGLFRYAFGDGAAFQNRAAQASLAAP